MVQRCQVAFICLWLAGLCQAQQPVFEKANDFVYTQADGEQSTLYALESEMLLLYFYDPTCEDCHALMEQLAASETVNQLIEENRLQILAVYPEDDMAEWKPYVSHIPPNWTNAYDDGARINMEGLYLFTSLPALYLLDGEKRICLQTTAFDDVERELKKELISNDK